MNYSEMIDNRISDLEEKGVYEVFYNGKRCKALYLGEIKEREGLTNLLLVVAPKSKTGKEKFHFRMFEGTYLVNNRLYLGRNFSIKDAKEGNIDYQKIAEEIFGEKLE